MSKPVWIAIVVVVALFAGVLWLQGKESYPAPDNAVQTRHIIGKADAIVSLVEYSDFQCPACKLYYPIIEQIIQKYGDRISFEYRHYPLATIHRHAFAAARASEAAAQQGKFWEMYRKLFENQQLWESAGDAQEIFVSFAANIGLDVAQFEKDFASSQTNSAINASIAEFNGQNLSKSTPTFLLDGTKIEARSVEDFSALIEERLQRSGQ